MDYKRVAKRVLAFVAGHEVQSGRDARGPSPGAVALAEFSLAWVRVSVNKPGAIRDSRDVGVSIERTPDRPAADERTFMSLPAATSIRQAQLARAQQRNWRGFRIRYFPLAIAIRLRLRRRGLHQFRGGFSTALPVPELLRVLRRSKRSAAAAPIPKWAPRAMDLDLLLYGDQVRDGRRYSCRGAICCAAVHAGAAGRAGAASAPSDPRLADWRSCGQPLSRPVTTMTPCAPDSTPLRACAHQAMLRPPSTASICPVTNGASAAKNSAALAMSSGYAGALQWCLADDFCLRAASMHPRATITGPGAMPLTRTSGASSRARARVSMISPALARSTPRSPQGPQTMDIDDLDQSAPLRAVPAAACARNNGARRLVPTRSSHCVA